MGGYGGFSHLALPALTLGLLGSGWYSRMLRSSMIEVLHQDFIRTARAKGLGRTRVLLRHVLPNAVLPLIPMIGIDIGIFMGGLVVVESVFGWPGIGQLASAGDSTGGYPGDCRGNHRVSGCHCWRQPYCGSGAAVGRSAH